MIFPYYVRTGGWVALAGKSGFSHPEERHVSDMWCLLGTHFHFIREIPILARYEVRSQIVGWDHKWVRHFPFRFFSVSQHSDTPFSCSSISSILSIAL